MNGILSVLLDTPVSGPPVSMGQNDTRELIFTVMCGLPLLFGLVMAVRYWITRSDPLLLICMIGGATSTIVEPLLDINGGVWWPAESWEAFNFASVNIPWLVPLVYPWLLGGQGYIAYRAFQRRANARQMWLLVLSFAASDVILEVAGLQLDVYAYYGPQPLKFLGLPIWYVPMNSGGPLIAGAIFYLLRPHFRGLRTLALLPVFPMSFALMYFGCGFPMWLALQSDWPVGVGALANLASFAMAYIMITFFLVATQTEGAVSAERADTDGPSGERPGSATPTMSPNPSA